MRKLRFIAINTILIALGLGLTSCGYLDNDKIKGEIATVIEESTLDKESSSKNQSLSDNPITSEDIISIAKQFNLNNYGNVASELITENLLLTYDNNCNITRCSNRTNKFNTKEGYEYNSVPSGLDIFTEYGKNELGYDTYTHIEFICDLNSFEQLKNYIVKVTYEDIVETIDIKSNNKIISDTLHLDNGIIKIEENFRENIGSISIKMDIYYNLGILNDSCIDTVELSKYEPLINNSSFESLKNFTKGSKINTDKVIALENSKEYRENFKIDTVEITRDWVSNKDKPEEYEIYNTSKEYLINSNDKVYKIKFNVDEYDKFNLHRLKSISLAGDSIDSCKTLIKGLTTITDEELDNLIPNEKYIISDNESMSLTKSEEVKDGFIWYLSYAVYDR